MKQPQEFIILNHREDFIYVMNTGRTKNVILPYEIDNDENTIRFFFHTDVNNEHRIQLLRKLIPLTMSIVERDIYVELLHNLEFSLEEVTDMPKDSGIINFSIFKQPNSDDVNVSIYSFHENCQNQEIAKNFLPDEDIEYLNNFHTNNLKAFPILCKNGNFILSICKKDRMRLYFSNFEMLIGDISSIMVVKLIKYILPYWRNIFKILYSRNNYIISLEDNIAELIPNNNRVKMIEYDYENVRLFT